MHIIFMETAIQAPMKLVFNTPVFPLKDHMHDAVNRFAGNAEQFDDITMLCFRYKG